MSKVETDIHIPAKSLDCYQSFQIGKPLTLMEILCNDSPLISGRSTPAFLSFTMVKNKENKVPSRRSSESDKPSEAYYQ